MFTIRIETERCTVEIRIDAAMVGLLIQVMLLAGAHLNSTTGIT